MTGMAIWAGERLFSDIDFVTVPHYSYPLGLYIDPVVLQMSDRSFVSLSVGEIFGF